MKKSDLPGVRVHKSFLDHFKWVTEELKSRHLAAHAKLLKEKAEKRGR